MAMFGGNPRDSYTGQRAQALALAVLFVAAFLVVLPLHLAHEHHPDWADARAGNHACDDERPSGQPMDEVHTHAEHFWAALPDKLADDIAGGAFLARAPQDGDFAFVTVPRKCVDEADFAPRRFAVLDLKRLRGPPLS